jgi:hypothetical protein
MATRLVSLQPPIVRLAFVLQLVNICSQELLKKGVHHILKMGNKSDWTSTPFVVKIRPRDKNAFYIFST